MVVRFARYAMVARVAKVARYAMVARYAPVARYAMVARFTILAIVAIPTTNVCFILFFKIGVFCCKIFAYAVNLFVFSVQKVLV